MRPEGLNRLQTKIIKVIIGATFLKGKDDLMAIPSSLCHRRRMGKLSRQHLLPNQVCYITHFYKFYKYRSCFPWIACTIFRYIHTKGIQGQQSLKAVKLFTSLLFIRASLGVLEAISS